ncbi:DCC1-like thiol-disulfide oxidoreductase family protein (plasmid) [Haladaptatus sp. SPP-AMP-3]|uniref:DCC1-like thiol-disulfide oxidoreductase family protein n=1 Tax=Haladaptatus sp. SPP-AMP-3 TaxID=3121295 RepID=UPI003C2DC26A
MTDYRAVLVFDGDCPFCSAAASALRRVRGVGAVPWDDAAAQSFLEAQFDETPFALVLAEREEERVYVGRDAARELCERAGVPTLVGDIVGDNYESIADAIRTVTGVDGDPDPYHGVHSMAEDARDRFDSLSANARSMSHVIRTD